MALLWRNKNNLLLDGIKYPMRNSQKTNTYKRPKKRVSGYTGQNFVTIKTKRLAPFGNESLRNQPQSLFKECLEIFIIEIQ